MTANAKTKPARAPRVRSPEATVGRLAGLVAGALVGTVAVIVALLAGVPASSTLMRAVIVGVGVRCLIAPIATSVARGFRKPSQPRPLHTEVEP